MDMTILEIPTELLQAAKLTPEEAKTELAIRLYQLHKLNDEQSMQLAADPKVIEKLAWSRQETGHFELDDFLSWAAHDLKTPLNAIIGFSRVVMKGIDGPVNEAQTTDLNTVFTGGQRMLSLLNNLVDMARLNNGQLALFREECDVSELLAEAAARWQTQNPAKPLTSAIKVAQPAFNVDAARLRQVFTNLLTQAAMRVTEGSLSLSVTDDEHGLQVVIQSRGEKSRDKFEMDAAMLGFISTSLVKLHGGKTGDIEETEDGILLRFSLPR